VKVIRRRERLLNLPSPRPMLPREHNFFYEKNTGVSHFHVEAGPDGQFPVEQAAGLLAMHCMVHGQTPRDHVVMVQAADDALAGLAEKAERLLRAGHSVSSTVVRPTCREEEVLGGIAGKEIAASLNLSERTVKFHLSSLLFKFRVPGRVELAHEAVCHITAPLTKPRPPATPEARAYAPAPHPCQNAARNMSTVMLPKRQLKEIVAMND
jgi:DNA-binding CsgD family transcriptional regulator